MPGIVTRRCTIWLMTAFLWSVYQTLLLWILINCTLQTILELAVMHNFQLISTCDERAWFTRLGYSLTYNCCFPCSVVWYHKCILSIAYNMIQCHNICFKNCTRLRVIGYKYFHFSFQDIIKSMLCELHE